MADDDDWFETEARERGRERISRDDDDDAAPPRTYSAPLILGGLIVLVTLIGVALGAFSGPSEPAPAPIASLDLDGFRAAARARTPAAALDETTLLKELATLEAVAPKPAPSNDGTKVEPVPAPTPEPIETGTTIIGEEAKVDPKPPKPKDPKDPKAKPEPKDPKVEAKVEPKKEDPKVEPKKEDPKVLTSGDKTALETAIANAKAAADAGRWSEAKGAYDKALGLSPGNATALYGRGRASFELKQSAAAMKDFEAVLAGNPKHPGALQLMGSLLQDAGRREEARALYQRYLDAYPNGRQANQIRALLERL